MCTVAYFFGEDIAWVYGTRDVVEIHLLGLDAVADCAVFKADMLHVLDDGAFGPVDCTRVVVVETGRSGGVGKIHVITPVSEREDLLDAFVRGTDFGFAGGVTCTGLADEFPGDGAAAAHDEKTAHGVIFEHLNLNAIFKRTSNLTSPVGVTEAL